MKSLLRYMLDENEFLSPYGIRSVSKYHLNNPYTADVDGMQFTIQYTLLKAIAACLAETATGADLYGCR